MRARAVAALHHHHNLLLLPLLPPHHLTTYLPQVVGSVTALMPEMIHRQRAWFSIGSQFFFTTGWVFFTIGAAAQVVLYGPGFLLFAGLNWLVAASLWFFAFIVRFCGAWYYRVPILSFATAVRRQLHCVRRGWAGLRWAGRRH